MINQPLFVINTPRHWLVAMLVVEQENYKSPVFIIENNFAGAENYFSLLKERFKDSVYLLPGKNELKHVGALKAYFLKNTDWFRQKRMLKQALSKNKIDGILIANDHSPICQYTLYWMEKNGLSCKCFYLDDGVATYLDRSRKPYDFIRLLKYKVSYGWWYQAPGNFGVSKWVDGAYVFNVSLAKPQIKKLNVVKEIDFLPLSDEKTDFINDVYKQAGFYLESLEKIQYLIVLDLVEYAIQFEADYLPKMLSIISSLQSKCAGSVAVKLHPREKEHNIQLFEKEALLLPTELPFELVVPFIDKKMCILGGTSTAIMDAKLIRNNVLIKAYSFPDLKEDVGKLFKKISIPLTDFDRWRKDVL